jgi:hypothetical protein
MQRETLSLVVWTANLGRGVGTRRFADVVDKLFTRIAATFAPSIVLLQEIDEADAPAERELVRKRTGVRWAIAGKDTAVPVLVDRRVRIVGRTITFASKGLAKITPHRVVVKAITTVDGFPIQVAVLNLHQARDVPATRLRRLRAWWVLRREIAEERAAGRAVIVGGDWNTRGRIPLARREAVEVRRVLDVLIAYAPDGWEWIVVNRFRHELGIDWHDAVGARLRLQRVAPARG